jgi:hypothetical protein
MIKQTALLLSAASIALAQSPAPTNAPGMPSGTISLQQMLVIGPSGLKLHSLAMLTQGKAKGGVDESFLPGFKACAEDPAMPVRSVAARVMGENLVAGKDKPNPEAVALLEKLAKDESSDVRYSAVYYGLSQIKDKSDAVVSLLLDVAAKNREQSLFDRIADALKDCREQAARILDKKLAEGDSIAYYEIYAAMTGKQPPDSEKYLNMPSSQPHLFIFKGDANDAEAYKMALEGELKSIGIENPDLFTSGVGESYVLMLKTYLTKDRLAVATHFADHGKFKITQDMWLTPELGVQIDSMRKSAQ